MKQARDPIRDGNVKMGFVYTINRHVESERMTDDDHSSNSLELCVWFMLWSLIFFT